MQVPDSSLKTAAEPANGVFQPLSQLLQRLLRECGIWRDNRRARKALEALPDRLLVDAGIERRDIAGVVDRAVRAKVARTERR